MKLKILISLLCLITGRNTILHAQSWEKLPAVISGKINKGLKPMDSVVIVLNYDFVLFGESKITVPIDKHGIFHYTTKAIDHPANLRSWIKNSDYGFINKIIEPGDSIFIDVDAIPRIPVGAYSGNNIGKYECISELQEKNEYYIDSRTKNPAIKSIHNNISITGDFQQVHRFYFSFYNDLLMVVEKFKTRLTPAMYQYLLATARAMSLVNWEIVIETRFGMANTELVKNGIIRDHGQYKYPFYPLNKSIAAYNQSYIQYLIYKNRNEVLLKTNGKGLNYRALYENLKTAHNGSLRDHLLTLFMADHNSSKGVAGFTPADYDYCLNDATNIVRAEALKQVLKNRATLKTGATVFNFSFPDSKEKQIRLSDLRGKVVLIDMWFTGCVGCSVFARNFMEQVYPKINDKAAFEVVSICVDKTKEKWLNSVKGGKYTNQHHLNLWTAGQQLNDPFSRYYQLNAMPFILLVDRSGKVFSKIDNSMSGQEVLKLINQAIDKN